MINTHKDHPDGDELIRKSDIYDILDNDYLVADRKEERLRGLKGIQPKRGEWKLETKRILQDNSGDKAIYGNQRFWKCPFCGETVSAGYSKPDYKFCYNCGADMRGDNK